MIAILPFVAAADAPRAGSIGRITDPDVDWAAVFLPTANIWELIVRAAVMYALVFALMRLAARRQASGLSVTDVLVVVLIADAAGPALSGAATSIADSALVVASIIAISHLFNWLAFHVRWVDRLINPQPVTLARHGAVDDERMRAELVTDRELQTELRKQGIDELKDAEAVYMEADGSISVIARDDDDPPAGTAPPRG